MIWDCAEEAQLNSIDLKKRMFLAEGFDGHTAWHCPALYESLEALEIIWSLAKEVDLKPDELLLSQVEEGYTALHLAARKNRVVILEKLWFWTEEAEVNANELKKKLLLAKDDEGYTVWHRAAKFGNL